MNPFERHGIARLSPSSLNHFAAEPAHWVMARLLNMRAPASAAAVRGSAVEKGVHLGLMNPDLPVEQCIAAAEAAFDREMVLNPDDRRESERSNPGYTRNALAELRPYGVPSAAQGRIEICIEGGRTGPRRGLHRLGLR
jgi:hypothetical protein